MKRLKILANILRYDYGRRAFGDSFEYSTFYNFFVSQGHQVDIFDYASVLAKGGPGELQQKLWKATKNKAYDLIFSVPFTNQLSPQTLDGIKKSASGTPSVAWMCDDKWRWQNFSKILAPHFDYIITTDPDAVSRYKSIGYTKVFLSQWGFDQKVYHYKKLKKFYDLTFIGGISPWREYVVNHLRKKGFSITCFGTGWENGRVTTQEVAEIYNQSKIVLNLSNSIQFNLPFILNIKPLQIKTTLKETIFHSLPGLVEFIISQKRKEDIKARFFEVTGCGAFLLSYDVEHIENYLTPEKDFAVYHDLNELESKARYYLLHDKQRQRIALQGFERSHREHTYKRRFEGIFAEIGIV